MTKTNSAGVFLVRENNMLLVCHPTNHSDDFWTIPKGKIDYGETAIQAAIRETFEETNVNLFNIKTLIPLEPVKYKSGKKTLHPFLLFETDSKELNWDTFDLRCLSYVSKENGFYPEIDNFRYVTLDEAKIILHESQVVCIDKIKRMINERD